MKLKSGDKNASYACICVQSSASLFSFITFIGWFVVIVVVCLFVVCFLFLFCFVVLVWVLLIFILGLLLLLLFWGVIP